MKEDKILELAIRIAANMTTQRKQKKYEGKAWGDSWKFKRHEKRAAIKRDILEMKFLLQDLKEELES